MFRIDFDRLRFLVIDDNAHLRRILRTLLHGFGAREVCEAAATPISGYAGPGGRKGGNAGGIGQAPLLEKVRAPD